MTPEKIQALATATFNHKMELTRSVSQDVLARIDETLSTHNREPVRVHDYIPSTPDKLDSELARAQRTTMNNLSEVQKLMSDAGRALTQSSMVQDEIRENLAILRAQNHAVSAQKISIMEDIHNGTGPLAPNTVKVLGAMRSNLVNALATLSSLEVEEYMDDEDEQPLIALFVMISMEELRRSSEEIEAKYGIVAFENPRPSREDVLMLSDFVKSHDHILQEVVANLDEDTDSPRF